MALDARKAPTNASEWSVSELAGALKRTLEDAYGYVRLKGEVSGYRGPHSSGHCYFSLKDQGARIDAVIWKGTFARLKVRPQEGLEVVALGKITTFPGKSAYQIVVDSLEPAGIGALMALLEERRRKLAAEGLFDDTRKRRLPYLPKVIGVVTSPTGAVIRDILHRLEDRFPRHVLVWPVRVQGEASGEEVAAAIRGFNALPPGGSIPRPDVLIVARGGGSIEDLWGFNDEAVVRAAAESRIPLVSAVGHETDWTLIDHAADLRAPTPTGAAEMVVPVRADLLGQVGDLARRHRETVLRLLDRRRQELRSAARALPSPEALLATKRQRLDLAAARLAPALQRNARGFQARLGEASRRLAARSPATTLARARARLDAVDRRPSEALDRLVAARRERLTQVERRLQAARGAFATAQRLTVQRQREQVIAAFQRLVGAQARRQERRRESLGRLAQLLDAFSYKSVLERGFALVRDAEGQPIRQAAAVAAGQALALQFADGAVRATAEGGPRQPRKAKAADASPQPTPPSQGTLFEA
ncbi:MAG TPA: exodeoxyribonuclease VII large subunit [Beijerinckiaceae bacterium]|jgi:exodeoxyribonuclease VII large subunit